MLSNRGRRGLQSDQRAVTLNPCDPTLTCEVSAVQLRSDQKFYKRVGSLADNLFPSEVI